MMLVPFIFQIINRGELEFEKGKNICKYNSIVLFVISVLLKVIANMMFIGGLGAIIYYYINLKLFVGKENKRQFENENWDDFLEGKFKSTGTKTDMNYIRLKEEKSNSDDFFDEKKLSKMYRVKNRSVISLLFVLSLIIILVLGCTLIFLYQQFDNSKKEYISEIKQKTKTIENLNQELDSITQGRSTTYTQYKLNFFNQNIVFVVSELGNHYYSYDCLQRMVNGNYQYLAFNKEAAIAQGYKAGSCSTIE